MTHDPLKSEDSANPDSEILNALRPSLATTSGPLIVISSPYAKRGALWERLRESTAAHRRAACRKSASSSIAQALRTHAIERRHHIHPGRTLQHH
jgi:hypothetical protein